MNTIEVAIAWLYRFVWGNHALGELECAFTPTVQASILYWNGYDSQRQPSVYK